MISDKLYILISKNNGKQIEDLMFVSLFTLKLYIQKYERLVCGEEYVFNPAGIVNKTGRYFLVDDQNEFTITEKPPWE